MERLAKDISSRWGSRSIQYAGALLSLAKIQSRDGFHGVAEGNLKVAISIADDHPEAGERKGIEARAELGCLYQALGRNAEAVQLLESAARLSAQLDSATASRVLQALGLGYIVESRDVDAIRCLMLASAQLSEEFGGRSRRVIEIEADIGRAYRRLRDYRQAEMHLLASLDARRANCEESVVGDRSSALDDGAIDLMYEIAELHLEFQDASRCAEFLKQSLSEISRDLGGDHAVAGRFYHLLGTVREAEGYISEAEEAFKAALSIRMKMAGDENRRAASNSAFALGALYHDCKRFREAEQLLMWAYTARPRVSEPDRRLAEIQGYLGWTYHQLGEGSLARVFIQAASEVFMATDGPGSAAVIRCNEDLARLHDSMGDSDPLKP
jgi:tetratricopeptide (TPR) repeat protein